MWCLNYRKNCLDSRKKELFFLKKSLIRKILILVEQGYEDIFITKILSRENIEESPVYLVEYRECNVAGWHYAFFCKEKAALKFIQKVKNKKWDYYGLTPLTVSDLLPD